VSDSKKPNLPANLPVDHANLPATYDAAVKAIEACYTVEEAKSWADKSAALAYYASQVDDHPLRRVALRAEARAVRRLDELLRQYPELHGGDRKSGSSCEPHNLISRRQAAHQAGMSDHQYRNTQAVGAIPRQEFEAAVESGDPPTVGQLAARADSSRECLNLKPPVAPPDTNSAARALREFAAFCATHDPLSLARDARIDTAAVRAYVGAIDAWLDCFVTALPSEEVAA
jgi:hypothetical protein